MCLDTIQASGRNLSGIGYKVFEKRDGKLFSLIYWVSTPRPLGKWLKASFWWLPRWFRGDSGWYIYLNLTGAKEGWGVCSSYTIYKVEYKAGHRFGWQSSQQVVIASKMRILEEVSKANVSSPTTAASAT